MSPYQVKALGKANFLTQPVLAGLIIPCIRQQRIPPLAPPFCQPCEFAHFLMFDGNQMGGKSFSMCTGCTWWGWLKFMAETTKWFRCLVNIFANASANRMEQAQETGDPRLVTQRWKIAFRIVFQVLFLFDRYQLQDYFSVHDNG